MIQAQQSCMKRYAFSKANRLRKRADFLRLSKDAAKVHANNFLLIYKPGATAGSRLGITVTRKVGSAVCRNAIKRQVREYYRHHRENLTGTWDLNVIAKHQAAGQAPAALQRSLAQLFASFAERTRH